MRKYLLYGLILVFTLLLVGCMKTGEKDIVKKFEKRIEKTNGYYVQGELEIINNEESYLYDVEVAYKAESNFRVSLKNKVNNHEQIILKNTDGVYVLTPSLNKSFKFQSEWPYNNSQSYLLQSILNDLKKDEGRIYNKTDDGYVFTTKVNYSNNNNLVKQNIYFDNDLNIKQVDVLNENDQIQMKMTFNSIDYNTSYDDTYFTLKGNSIQPDSDQTTSTTIDSIAYPMYIPENTYLANQEKTVTEDGERVILTFNGENPFMIIQENAKVEKELLTIPMYGEPYIITGTVGVLSDSSVTWISNGVEFYVVSDILSVDKLIEVANSFGSVAVNK